MLGALGWTLLLAVYAAITATYAIVWERLKWERAGQQAARVKRDVSRMDREAHALKAYRARFSPATQMVDRILGGQPGSRPNWRFVLAL